MVVLQTEQATVFLLLLVGYKLRLSVLFQLQFAGYIYRKMPQCIKLLRLQKDEVTIPAGRRHFKVLVFYRTPFPDCLPRGNNEVGREETQGHFSLTKQKGCFFRD